MSKYIKYYETTTELTSAINTGVDKPHVSLGRSGWSIRYVLIEESE